MAKPPTKWSFPRRTPSTSFLERFMGQEINVFGARSCEEHDNCLGGGFLLGVEDGFMLLAERAGDEQTSEFLASRDNWFRPSDVSIPLGSPIDAEHGVNPKEPRTTLETPEAGVIEGAISIFGARFVLTAREFGWGQVAALAVIATNARHRVLCLKQSRGDEAAQEQ